jgi:hypothetical protein
VPDDGEIRLQNLDPWRTSASGIDYVHTFDSGRPGPHVVVNALTRGNELCGMAAVADLLTLGVRPVRGRLTLSFANVEAYRSFVREDPEASKFVDVNMNRIWTDAILAGPSTACEVRRARQMQPVVREADALLDLLANCHLRDPSGWNDPPLLSYVEKPAARALAARMGYPAHQIGCPPAGDTGLLFAYGRFSDPASPAVGLLVECGPHFAPEARDVAFRTALRFLDAAGVIEPDLARRHGAVPVPVVRRYTDMLTPVAQSDAFRWLGHEEFPAGGLIAHDGEEDVRAPYDRCVLIAVPSVVRKGDGIGHLVRRLP